MSNRFGDIGCGTQKDLPIYYIDAELLKYILDNANLNGNFNLFDQIGQTPLVCRKGQVEVVKFYLANYTRLGICCSFYRSARNLAQQKGHVDVVNLLGRWNLFKSMMTSLFDTDYQN